MGIPFNGYASEVAGRMRTLGYCAEADTDDGNTMNKKVRNAQIAQYNFIFGELSALNHTECPKIYRKSVLYLLKYTANLYQSRCSTDLR